MSDIKSVLFVCTGNSCRSVMAEGLLKKKLAELGKKNIEVSSVGVGAFEGADPTAETIEVMKEEGIDVSGYRSKRLTDELVKKAGLILVMEERHRDDIITRAPEAAAKTQLLKKFGLECALTKPGGFAVPDPIGRPIKDYEYCLSVIKREIERIAELL